MKRFTLVVGAVALAFLATGCSNKGDELADEINKEVVGKIQKGEIETLEDATKTADNILIRKANEMKDNDDTLTESEGETLKKKLKEFEPAWDKLIKDKKKKK